MLFRSPSLTQDQVVQILAKHAVPLADGTPIKYGRVEGMTLRGDYLEKVVKYIHLKHENLDNAFLEVHILKNDGVVEQVKLEYFHFKGKRYLLKLEVAL